jgi:hypothetical protein
MVTPSLLLPDIDLYKGVKSIAATEGGVQRILLPPFRVLAGEDGTLERASERLPIGGAGALELPERLGGGFLFVGSRGGAQIWRSPTWLGALTPVAQLPQAIEEVVAGFDRVYLRVAASDKLLALDPKTGALLSVGSLPLAGAYGALAFADGWRAVVDVDVRGPLATFDAGATWRPLGIREPVGLISVVDGDPSVMVPSGSYAVDARGRVSFAPQPSEADELEPEDAHGGDAGPAGGPLGRRPLRAAIEDGWPDSRDTAVVARKGALARISLKNGAVLDLVADAFPEREASCHAIGLGSGFGFVCGVPDGPTVVYAYAPEAADPRRLALRPVMRFSAPRYVAASGHGALVIRGGCTDRTTGRAGTLTYCVRDAEGRTREVRLRGELGSERVVALSDGAVAVLVPPRLGAQPRLTILARHGATTVPLRLPTEPPDVARHVQHGMWLDGFQEREPGVLGGWVEAGGPVVGVRVRLDGKVTVGEIRGSDEGSGVTMSGRFAVARFNAGRAAESVDGGMTWSELDLPVIDDESVPGLTQGCGPVGCVLGRWLRVGWGPTRMAGDFKLAVSPPPRAMAVPFRSTSHLLFDCAPTGVVASARDALDGRATKLKAPPKAPKSPRARRTVASSTPAPRTDWMPFRNAPAPELGTDDVGLMGGATGEVSVRVYAWGKRGSDWSSSGHLQMRFDDRFDLAGGARSSALSASPWSSETSAASAIGGYVTWGAFLDPQGHAAIVQGCRGSQCSLFSVVEGQPIVPLQDEGGRMFGLPKPLPQSAVRVGDTWWLLLGSAPRPGGASESIGLFRVDQGILREVTAFHQPRKRFTSSLLPRLVRRARTSALGVLTATPASAGESSTWLLLPIDLDTGALGEMVALGPRDLARGEHLRRCAPAQDGWQFDTYLDAPSVLKVDDERVAFEAIQYRVRVDPGGGCVEGMAATMSTAPSAATAVSKPLADDSAFVPFAATDAATGSRWLYQCRSRALRAND